MALISYMLGGAQGPTSTPIHNHQRKRLRKAPPKAKSTQTLYSCKDILDIVRAQSCLVLFKADENSTEPTDVKSDKDTETKPHINIFPGRVQEDSTQDFISNYPVDEMDTEHPRRTRAKTPVFVVGQLERNSGIKPSDRAKTLAEQYQALLPPRTFTPYPFDLPRLTPKKLQKLRKIKCQLSLRDIVKEHSNRTHSVAYSDAETLVGSESPASQHSPTRGEFEKVKLPIIHPHEQAGADPMAVFDDDIGLKICVDLLTNELASQLFRQHPAEREDRASGLQILLMIEAYETVQQHVRQKLCDPHVSQEMKDHVRSVDRILKYWLKVLYSVYDQSQEKNFQNKAVEEQRFDHNSPEEIHSAGDECQR